MAKKHIIPDSLTHSAGTIFAVIGSTTYSVALSGLSNYALYYLFIVPGGTLVYSTNNEVTGPAGYTSWIWVGNFGSNGSAAFNFFGEMLDTGITSLVALTNNTAKTVATLTSVPAGTWDFSGHVYWVNGAPANVTTGNIEFVAGFGPNLDSFSGAYGGDLTHRNVPSSGGGNESISFPDRRVTLSSPTTVYLTMKGFIGAGFSGTNTGQGQLMARRVRE